jgi:hypothetical protein
MKMKRRGGRKMIIVSDGLGDGPPSKPNCNIPLAAVVARAHHWHELFLSGKYSTITELANKVGLDRSFVARIMRLALLAPDIVAAIMDDNGPDSLTFTKLTAKPLPVEWQVQRKLWGFGEPPQSLSQ